MGSQQPSTGMGYLLDKNQKTGREKKYGGHEMRERRGRTAAPAVVLIACSIGVRASEEE
jgi:hypothetical protein